MATLLISVASVPPPLRRETHCFVIFGPILPALALRMMESLTIN